MYRRCVILTKSCVAWAPHHCHFLSANCATAASNLVCHPYDGPAVTMPRCLSFSDQRPVSVCQNTSHACHRSQSLPLPLSPPMPHSLPCQKHGVNARNGNDVCHNVTGPKILSQLLSLSKLPVWSGQRWRWTPVVSSRSRWLRISSSVICQKPGRGAHLQLVPNYCVIVRS